MTRKVGVLFEPEQVLRYVEEPDAVRSHEQLVRDYLEVLGSFFYYKTELVCAEKEHSDWLPERSEVFFSYR